MPDSIIDTNKDFPQYSESWFLSQHKLKIWGHIQEEAKSFPHLVILSDLRNAKLLNYKILIEELDVEEIKDFIIQTINHTKNIDKHAPHRPIEILCNDQALTKSMPAKLGEMDVSFMQAPTPDFIAPLVEEIKRTLESEPLEIPALLSVSGVTPEIVGELFSAAADFYHLAPWSKLDNNQPLQITLTESGEIIYAQLMGSAGLEFGIVIFWDWEDLLRVKSVSKNPMDHIPIKGWQSLTFESVSALPLADIEACKRNGWEIAAEDAYPFPVTYTSENIMRPSKSDLVLYTALLRTIPLFLESFDCAAMRLNHDSGGKSYAFETQERRISFVIDYPSKTLIE